MLIAARAAVVDAKADADVERAKVGVRGTEIKQMQIARIRLETQKTECDSLLAQRTN